MRYFPEWTVRPPAAAGSGEQECNSYFGGGYAEEVGCSDAFEDLTAGRGAGLRGDGAGGWREPLHAGYPAQGKRFSRGGVYENCVHSVGRCDERLKELICESLADDPRIDGPDGVAVSVRDLEVTLEGEVADERTREVIEDLLARTRGIRRVRSCLRVRVTNPLHSRNASAPDRLR